MSKVVMMEGEYIIMRKRGYIAFHLIAVLALALGTTACGSKVDKETQTQNTDGDRVTVTLEAEKLPESQIVTATPNEENVKIVYDMEYEVAELEEGEKFYEIVAYEENSNDLVEPLDAAKFVKTILIAKDNYEKLPDGKVRAYSYEGIEMVNGERCFLIAQGEDDDERFMAVNRYAVGTGENAKIYYDDIVTCMYQEVAEVIDGGKAIRLLADEKN